MTPADEAPAIAVVILAFAADPVARWSWPDSHYVLTTGGLFALLAVAHLARTIVEWPRLAADPWFILEGPGIGVLAAAICVWAWWLVRVPATAQ